MPTLKADDTGAGPEVPDSKEDEPPQNERTMTDGIFIPPGDPPPRINNTNIRDRHIARFLIDRFGPDYYNHLMSNPKPSIYKTNPYSKIPGYRINSMYAQSYRRNPLVYLKKSREKNEEQFNARQNFMMAQRVGVQRQQQQQQQQKPQPPPPTIDLTGDPDGTDGSRPDPTDNADGADGADGTDGGLGPIDDSVPVPSSSEEEGMGMEDESDTSTEFTYISNRKNKIKVRYTSDGDLQTQVTVRADKAGNQVYIVSFIHTSGTTHYVTGKYGHSKNAKNAVVFKEEKEARKFLERFNYIILSQDGKADAANQLYREYKRKYPNDKLDKLLPGMMEARKKRKPKVKKPVSWKDSEQVPMPGQKKKKLKIQRDSVLIEGARAEQDQNNMLYMYLPNRAVSNDAEEQKMLDRNKNAFLTQDPKALVDFFKTSETADAEDYNLDDLDFATSPEGLKAITRALFIQNVRAVPGMTIASQRKAQAEAEKLGKKYYNTLRGYRRTLALRKKRYFTLPKAIQGLYDQAVKAASYARKDDDPTLLAVVRRIFKEGYIFQHGSDPVKVKKLYNIPVTFEVGLRFAMDNALTGKYKLSDRPTAREYNVQHAYVENFVAPYGLLPQYNTVQMTTGFDPTPETVKQYDKSKPFIKRSLQDNIQYYLDLDQTVHALQGVYDNFRQYKRKEYKVGQMLPTYALLFESAFADYKVFSLLSDAKKSFNRLQTLLGSQAPDLSANRRARAQDGSAPDGTDGSAPDGRGRAADGRAAVDGRGRAAASADGRASINGRAAPDGRGAASADGRARAAARAALRGNQMAGRAMPLPPTPVPDFVPDEENKEENDEKGPPLSADDMERLKELDEIAALREFQDETEISMLMKIARRAYGFRPQLKPAYNRAMNTLRQAVADRLSAQQELRAKQMREEAAAEAARARARGIDSGGDGGGGSGGRARGGRARGSIPRGRGRARGGDSDDFGELLNMAEQVKNRQLLTYAKMTRFRDLADVEQYMSLAQEAYGNNPKLKLNYLKAMKHLYNMSLKYGGRGRGAGAAAARGGRGRARGAAAVARGSIPRGRGRARGAAAVARGRANVPLDPTQLNADEQNRYARLLTISMMTRFRDAQDVQVYIRGAKEAYGNKPKLKGLYDSVMEKLNAALQSFGGGSPRGRARGAAGRGRAQARAQAARGASPRGGRGASPRGGGGRGKNPVNRGRGRVVKKPRDRGKGKVKQQQGRSRQSATFDGRGDGRAYIPRGGGGPLGGSGGFRRSAFGARGRGRGRAANRGFRIRGQPVKPKAKQRLPRLQQFQAKFRAGKPPPKRAQIAMPARGVARVPQRQLIQQNLQMMSGEPPEEGTDTSQPLYDVNEVYSGPRDRVFGRQEAARNQYRTPIKRPPGMKINSKKVQYYMQQSFEPKFALAEESLLYPSIFGKMHSGIICPFPCQMVNGVCECD